MKENMRNNIFSMFSEEERASYEQSIRCAVGRLVAQCTDKMQKCLTLHGQSNVFFLRECIDPNPTFLRTIDFHLELHPRGYILWLVPGYERAKDLTPYYGRVSVGTMRKILKRLGQENCIDALTHQLIALVRLSYHDFWFQRLADRFRKMF